MGLNIEGSVIPPAKPQATGAATGAAGASTPAAGTPGAKPYGG